jgi:hypothetical protein
MKRTLRAVPTALQAIDLEPFEKIDAPLDDDASRPGASDILLRLQLDAADLERLDQVSRTTKFTRNRWIAALVHQALSGRAQVSSGDRVNIAGVVRELRKIETTLQKSSRALAELEATAKQCLARCREMERFRDDVGRMAGALDEVFRGNDAYWREVVGEAEHITTPRSAAKRIR